MEDFDFSLVGTKIESDLRFVQKIRRRATTVGFAYSLDYNTVNVEPLIYKYGTVGIDLPQDVVAQLNNMPLFRGYSLYFILDIGDKESQRTFTFFEEVADPQEYVLIPGLFNVDTDVDYTSEIVRQIINGEYSQSFDFGSFCSLLKYNLRNNIDNDDIDLQYYIIAEFDEAGTKDVINFVIPEFEYSIADPNYAGLISESVTVTTAAYRGIQIDFETVGQYMIYVYGSRQDTVESQLEKNLPFGTEIVGWSLTKGGEKICDKYGSLGVLDGDKTFYAIIDYKSIPFQIVDHNHEVTEKIFRYYDWVGLSDADVPEIISLDGAEIIEETDADENIIMICTGYTLAYGEKKRNIGSNYDSKFTVIESGVITPIYERAYKVVINLNGGKVKEEYASMDVDDNADTFTFFMPEGEYAADYFMNYFTHDRDSVKGIVYENDGIAYVGKKVLSTLNLNKSVTLDALHRAITNLYVQSDYSTITNVYNALFAAGYDVELTEGGKEVALRIKPLQEVLDAIILVRSLSVDDPIFTDGSVSHEFKGLWSESNGPSGYFLDAVYEAGILCYTVIANSTLEARFDDGTTVHTNFYRIDTDLNTVLFRYGWSDEFHLDIYGYSTDYYKKFYGWELPDGTVLRNCTNEELKEGEVNSYVPNSVCTLNVTAKFIDSNRIKYKLRFLSSYYFEEAEQYEIVLEGYYGETVTGIPTPKDSGWLDGYWGIPVFAGWSVEIPEKFGYNRDLDGKGELLYPTNGDVSGEMIIRAVYTYKSVPVNYYINGELYETIELKHGDRLSFPTVNVPKGKAFYGWFTFAGNSLPIYEVSESETVSGLFNYHYYGFMMDEAATFEVRYYVPDLWLEDEYRLLFVDDCDFSIIDDITQYELCFEPFGFAWEEERYLYADENFNIYMKVNAVFSDELPEAELPMYTVDDPTEETQHIKFYLDGELYQVVQTNDMKDFYRPEVEIPQGKVFIGWFWREYGGPFSVLPDEITFEYDVYFTNNAVYGFAVDENSTFNIIVTCEEYDPINETYNNTTQEITLSFADFDTIETVLEETLDGYDYYVGYYTTTDGEFYVSVYAYPFE